jgi:hypothetical protein
MHLHRRNVPLALAVTILLPAMVRSGEHGGGLNCTDPAVCASCGPACKATWDEVKTRKPAYSIKCEYASARDYDCWCAEEPECRCSPPCGKVIVKKRFYKAEGEEKVEKVPNYEVVSAPTEPCDCARCQGVCFWNPLAVLHYLLHH